MFDLFESIDNYIRELLCGIITSNMTTMYSDLNVRTASIASEVSQTPQSFNGSVFNMIQSLSSNVMVPIAGIIITLILTYELISMITEKNNYHDIDGFMIFKWIMKSAISIWMLTHVFECVMGIFDIGQSLVDKAAAVIIHDTQLDTQGTIDAVLSSLEGLGTGELISLSMETSIVSMCMKIISILIFVILYGRMIEIYLYTSVAPVPFATFANREWGQIGTNYLRGLLALAFQGFLLMVCVGIYAAIIKDINISGDIHTALFTVMSYTVVLCFTLFKTGGLSKQIFNAH